MAAQGRDIKLSEGRIQGYRNFATKLWNAARYAEINGCKIQPSFDPKKCSETVNKWIVTEVIAEADNVGSAIEEYRFNDAANSIYHFIWGTFCDRYLEFTKPILSDGERGAAKETRATTAWALKQLINILNPIMPYLTEELWTRLGGSGLLMTSPWPKFEGLPINQNAKNEMDWVIRVITEIRSIRSEMNIPSKIKIDLLFIGLNKTSEYRLDQHRDIIMHLGRLKSAKKLNGDVPTGVVQGIVDEATMILPIANVVNLEKEQIRLKRDIDKIQIDIKKTEQKLANQSFINKAPEEVVLENRNRLNVYQERKKKLLTALNRIQAN